LRVPIPIQTKGNVSMRHMSRRDTLKLSGVVIAVLAGVPTRARAEAESLISDFSRGKTPRSDGLVLDIPLAAENANAVPVTIRLDKTVQQGRGCEEFLLIAERNPIPETSRFKFSPTIGMADVTTRIRLAESQTVIAMARMSDGEIFIQRVAVTVTFGGCNG
jgi:sulfur-oxidizing protein SoxY